VCVVVVGGGNEIRPEDNDKSPRHSVPSTTLQGDNQRAGYCKGEALANASIHPILLELALYRLGKIKMMGANE
jgi:hypothetical protein